MLTRYRDFLSGKHDVQFIITCDILDLRMNNRRMRRWLREFAESVPLSYHFGWSWTKVQAINANMAGRWADVLLVASDDMNPQVKGYDDRIFSVFAERFPDYRGAIRFYDEFREGDLMTYPVIGWPLYEAFGYIFHPKYRSVYCDNEQTEVCKALNCFAIEPDCLLRHEWPPSHRDLLYHRNESRLFRRWDSAVYEKRQANGFDLQRISRALYGKTG